MSALTFAAQNGLQLVLCGLLALAAWCVHAHRTAKPWTEPYTEDRPEQDGDLSPLDRMAGRGRGSR